MAFFVLDVQVRLCPMGWILLLQTLHYDVYMVGFSFETSVCCVVVM